MKTVQNSGQCACGSGQNFSACCEIYLTGEKFPATAEQLMRSRYVAFTKIDMPYLKKTLAPESQGDFDLKSNREWAEQAEWLGLEIHAIKDGQESDQRGTVEFTASYRQQGKALRHKEVAQFRKDSQGHWLFVDGEADLQAADSEGKKITPAQRQSPKIGRNDPCHCGSGKKFKKCCGTEEA